jgi:hypothetical protein
LTTSDYVSQLQAAIGSDLSFLVGATIVVAEAVVQNDDNSEVVEVWPVLQVRTTDGRTFQIEVSCDPEGNGPGHLFITEAVDYED